VACGETCPRGPLRKRYHLASSTQLVEDRAVRTNGLSQSRAAIASALVVLAIAGCGSDDTPEAAPSTSDQSTPSIDDRFDVDSDGRQLALRCWGDGSPTLVFDAGSGASGIGEFATSPIVSSLAERTRVCTYDRAGLGASDPAPAHKRGLDDAVDDLHALLDAAEVEGPYVLVGSSGGGFNVYHYAGKHPDDVVGLVMLDVPAGQANIPPSAVPAWDSSDNPEHMDYGAVERQMATDRLPIPEIPVSVVHATGGQSASAEEQRVWLEGSSDPVLVELDGGHVIYADDPEGVRSAVEELLDSVE
jgi:pimeloyl-ACP methyl ester carboxylesterase